MFPCFFLVLVAFGCSDICSSLPRRLIFLLPCLLVTTLRVRCFPRYLVAFLFIIISFLVLGVLLLLLNTISKCSRL